MIDDAGRGVEAGEILHASMRGMIAAMAMSGMRSFTVSVGLVEEVPPRALARRATHGLIRVRPADRLGLAVDHLLYGLVLSETRRRPSE